MSLARVCTPQMRPRARSAGSSLQPARGQHGRGGHWAPVGKLDPDQGLASSLHIPEAELGEVAGDEVDAVPQLAANPGQEPGQPPHQAVQQRVDVHRVPHQQLHHGLGVLFIIQLQLKK